MLAMFPSHGITDWPGLEGIVKTNVSNPSAMGRDIY